MVKIVVVKSLKNSFNYLTSKTMVLFLCTKMNIKFFLTLDTLVVFCDSDIRYRKIFQDKNGQVLAKCPKI